MIGKFVNDWLPRILGGIRRQIRGGLRRVQHSHNGVLRCWRELKRRRRRRRTIGWRGERAAANYLRRRKKMLIVQISARIGRGEIDLVAVDGETVVFVEVKTRRTHSAGHPAEAVDARKQIQLTRLALQYLRRHNLLDYAWRFDIVAVTWPGTARHPTVEHIPAAFAPLGVESMFT